eukprot:718982-Pyramimonas_sp.AAC.1
MLISSAAAAALPLANLDILYPPAASGADDPSAEDPFAGVYVRPALSLDEYLGEVQAILLRSCANRIP